MDKANSFENLRCKGYSAQRKRLVAFFLVLTLVFSAAFMPFQPAIAKRFVLVLDAGHGGKDPGNLGTGRHKTTEKDISLDVVLALGKYIEENHPEIQVVYTRKNDTFPTLKERVEIANQNQADLFISVHCNANDNKEAYGAETYVMGLHKSEESLRTAMRENASIYLEDNKGNDYDGFDPKNPDTYIALSLRENVFLDQSLGLAKHVQDQFRVRVGRKDRGVKQAGYYVISFTNMPSILVELGFLTNAVEEDFLQSDKGKDYMSSAIYRAFKKYMEKSGVQAAPPAQETRPVKNGTTEPVTTGQVASKISTSDAQSAQIPYKEVNDGVRFQIQFMTSPKPINTKSEEFKKFPKIDELAVNGIYKYMTGCTPSFTEAKKIQQVIREMGYKDAFIVAWEGNERIDLKTAVSKSKN